MKSLQSKFYFDFTSINKITSYLSSMDFAKEVDFLSFCY